VYNCTACLHKPERKKDAKRQFCFTLSWRVKVFITPPPALKLEPPLRKANLLLPAAQEESSLTTEMTYGKSSISGSPIFLIKLYKTKSVSLFEISQRRMVPHFFFFPLDKFLTLLHNQMTITLYPRGIRWLAKEP
jgi:hypothetical protein